MFKVQQEVLAYCIRRARHGEKVINVFDIIYETGYSYDRLEKPLALLVKQNELNRIDIKTVEFIGDINRQIGEEIERQDERAQRMEYLEKRRREIMRRMEEMHDDDD